MKQTVNFIFQHHWHFLKILFMWDMQMVELLTLILLGTLYGKKTLMTY